MKSKTFVATAALAALALAHEAAAGGQQVVAQVSVDGQSIVVRTYRCGTPSSLSLRGTAFGTVAGERRTLELQIAKSEEPGVFTVVRQWPGEGRWALVFSVQGGHAASTLVTLEPGPALRIADQERSYDRPTPERIDAVLARAGAVAAR